MPFNSIDFAIFLPIVFLLYWFVANRNLALQNFLIVAASFVFYGWWDWRFLILLSSSAVVDYILAIRIDRTSKQTKKNIIQRMTENRPKPKPRIARALII